MTSIKAEAKNFSLGGQKYSESRAIVIYYASKYCNSGPDSLGTTSEEQATVDHYWIELGDSALAHSSEQKLKAVCDVYEHRLLKSRYLARESYSLADLSHLPRMRYLIDEVGLAQLVNVRKHVNAWWEDISSRPAWK
ncbi:hypothetical protein EZV62_004784 [Acer yangbiense]|uniref:glutathione transferase n=1 Tax=Acer yangbiense TaxID=1000413 RepID=A0A5C7IL85_9ROSI|nr:hypothetical protein EZV62_004784 [Acer yangbiense]